MPAAPLVAAALLTLAFPPFDLGVLAWLALAPLAWSCVALPAGAAFAQGLAFGLVSTLAIFRWMFEVPGFGVAQAAPLALYLALYPALWCAALPRLARSRLPLPLSAAAWWVVLDWIRSHAGFLALPWATLAHTQHDNLAVLQMASITGESGVTLLIVAFNVALAGVPRGRRAWGIVAALVALAHAAGALAMRDEPEATTLAVAVAQPAGRLDRLPTLTAEAARQGATFVAWPEGALRDGRQLDGMAAAARDAGVTVIAGVMEAGKVLAADAIPAAGDERPRHNAAWLAERDGTLALAYRKQRLLPFAETLPALAGGTWPEWLVGRVDALSPGPDRPPPLRTRLADVGVLICWEGLFADLARASVRQGARLLVQPTNDAWFGRSAAAPQHNLASVLRAVELGTPVAVASTTGPSQVVDGRGRIVARVDAFETGVAVATVALRSRHTIYAACGDAWLVLVLALACIALAQASFPQGGRS